MHVICPRHPTCIREYIKRPAANRIHGNLTLAPSLWPDRELRKYHYSSCLSWPPREQPGSICISFIARLLKRVVAHLQVWLGTICPGTSNVLDECVFNCQGAWGSRLTANWWIFLHSYSLQFQKNKKSSLQRKSELFRTFYVNLLKIGEKCDILINTEGIEY